MIRRLFFVGVLELVVGMTMIASAALRQSDVEPLVTPASQPIVELVSEVAPLLPPVYVYETPQAVPSASEGIVENLP